MNGHNVGIPTVRGVIFDTENSDDYTVIMEMTASRSVALGFHRYGHPDGPVYLPTDCENFDDHPSGSSYAPTWERFEDIWLREGDKLQAMERKALFAEFRLSNPPYSVNLRSNPETNGDLPGADSAQPPETDSGQPSVKDFAVVICAPMLTAKLVKHLKQFAITSHFFSLLLLIVHMSRNGYDVDPLAMMPFSAQPAPFERTEAAMIIRLWLPQCPKYQGSTLLGTNDQPLERGEDLTESLLLCVKQVHNIPTIMSFTCPGNMSESMKMTLNSGYWKHRFEAPEPCDLHRRLPLPFFWYCSGESTCRQVDSL